MKIKRKDYRSDEEWKKACKALKKFNRSRNTKKKPRKRKKLPKAKKRLTSRQRKYHKYLLSDEWAQIKIDLFEMRGRKCEKCGSTSSLQVHHLTYKNIFEEEPEDLIIVCRGCHRAEHDIE